MTVVVDASVAVAWLAQEDGSARARRLALSDRMLVAPEFLLLEVASALTRRATGGTVPPGFAAEAVRALRRRRALDLRPTGPLIEGAAALAEQLAHPIYDCLYLALAQREGAALASFDQRLARKAQRLSIPLWAADDDA